MAKNDKPQAVTPPAISAPAVEPKAVAAVAPVTESPAVSATTSDDTFTSFGQNDAQSVEDREHAELLGIPYEPPAEAVAATTEPEVEVDPVTGQPVPVDETTVAEAGAPAAEVPSDAVAVAAPDAAPAAPAPAEEPAAPVAAAPIADPPANPYDPNETIKIAEGYDWSRSQLLGALNLGVATKQEADAFRTIFGMTAGEATTQWKPIMDKLRGEPAFADYLQRAIDHYNAETAGTPAPEPQYAPIDPTVRNEIAELRAWKQRQETTAQQSLYAQHEQTAFEQFPILKEDPQIYAFVAQRTQYRIQNGNPNYTLLDGVKESAPWLAEQTALRRPKPVAVTTPPPEIPVLQAGAGAAPAATRSTSVRAVPKKFSSTEEAVADWLANPAPVASGFN